MRQWEWVRPKPKELSPGSLRFSEAEGKPFGSEERLRPECGRNTKYYKAVVWKEKVTKNR